MSSLVEFLPFEDDKRKGHVKTRFTSPKYDQQDESSSKTSGRGDGKPKLFQCTGFGDCHMVFTRSEHLARHARKHTGEKPFQCVVPGCNRWFSRFDNMMQHTQTHNHRSSKSSQMPFVSDQSKAPKKKSKRYSDPLPSSEYEEFYGHGSYKSYNDYSPNFRQHHAYAPHVRYSHNVFYPPYADHPPPNYRHSYPSHQSHRVSYVPISAVHGSPYPHSPHQYPMYPPPSVFPPQPRSPVMRQAGSAHEWRSQDQKDVKTLQPKPLRRLSVADLCNPLENLRSDAGHDTMESDTEESEAIDLTVDELEALQAISALKRA